jgi:hypothetical protein
MGDLLADALLLLARRVISGSEDVPFDVCHKCPYGMGNAID